MGDEKQEWESLATGPSYKESRWIARKLSSRDYNMGVGKWRDNNLQRERSSHPQN